MMKGSRKCAKCGNSTAKEPSLALYHFPRPGRFNVRRAQEWARFCYPDQDWASPQFQSTLCSGHKMLCHRHFSKNSFVDYASKKLHRYATPCHFDNQESQSSTSMVLRWGIISAGKISHDFVNAFNSYPEKSKDSVIAAVAARNPNNAKEFAETHNIQNVFNTYQEMAKSQDIDIAYIGALNPQHYELVKLFLENGKHVLCEKPLCLNWKQVNSLINLAKSKKLFLMEAVWSRYLPSYIALEKEIKSGKLGDILFVEANFGIPVDSVDRLRKKELGGSTLLDLGIYVLQFAQFVFKEEPIKVVSSGELNEDGVDMAVSMILEYSGGRRAVLTAHSRLQLDNRATVYGTKGRAMLKDPFHCAVELMDSEGKIKQFPLHESNLPYNFTNSAALVYEALEVVKCINKGLLESPRMTHSDSLVLAKLEDKIRQQLGVHYDVDDIDYP